MQTRRRYRELEVWQLAMDFVDDVYDATESWPKTETYRLTDQLRRSAISVPANIAEGQGRQGAREFAHHLSIAYGSLMEAETLVSLGRRRRFLDQATEETLLDQSDRIGRMIFGLITSLRRSLESDENRRDRKP